MPLIRKRRAQAIADEDDEDTSATTTPAPARDITRASSEESEHGEASTANRQDADDTTHQQRVKDLVRLALACEYSRIPIRRADISAKVLGAQGSRQFKPVFEGAQLALRDTFGMEMVELPAKERVTLNQRRAAQKAGGGANGQGSAAAASNRSWVLQSALPDRFKTAEILRPAAAPTSEHEAAYVALYSFVIALLVLSGGTLAEPKLERYLRRVNAEQSTPVDKTDKALARMVREGYIFRNAVTSGGETVMEYGVGPRGRVEVGDQGVAGLVRRVYGAAGQGDDEELEKRLERSLRVNATNRQGVGTGLATQQGGEVVGDEASVPRGRGRGRPRKQQQGARDDDDDDEDEDEGSE